MHCTSDGNALNHSRWDRYLGMTAAMTQVPVPATSAQYVTPKLSAIEDQSRLMGQTACRLLLKNIGGDRKIYREIVPQKVIIRDTSARR